MSLGTLTNSLGTFRSTRDIKPITLVVLKTLVWLHSSLGLVSENFSESYRWVSSSPHENSLLLKVPASSSVLRINFYT